MSYENPVVGGTVLRTAAIQSPDFQLGPPLQGWSIQQNGNAYFGNIDASGTITGGTVVVDGTTGGVFVYSGAPAAGNLILSIAGAAGTDAYGNAYTMGLESGAAGSAEKIIMGVLGGSPIMYFLSAIATALNNAAIQLLDTGSGTAEYDDLVIKSSQDETYTDYSVLQLIGNSGDGTTQKTELKLTYVDTTGTVHDYLIANQQGATLAAAAVTAIHPGSSPAASETWQTPTLDTGWTVTGAGNPVRYRLLPDGNVQMSGEVLTTAANAAGTNIFAMPTGYIPAFQCSFITESAIAVGAGMATVTVLNSSGNVKCQQAFTASGQLLRFDGIIYPTT